MIRGALLAAAVLLTGCEHAVSYGPQTRAGDADLASDTGLPVPPPPLTGGPRAVVVSNPAALDHQVVILGIYCSAHKFANQLSTPVTQRLGQYASQLADSPARLTVRSASTSIRCFETGEYRMNCIAGMTIAASLAADGEDRPINVRFERTARGEAMACAHFGRVTAAVSQLGAAELVNEVDRALRGQPARG